MRLLMTTDTVGGVLTFTRELAGGLLRQGCEVLLLSIGRLPSAAQVAEIATLRGEGRFAFAALEADLEWMPNNDGAYTSAEPHLLQHISSFQPDVLLLSQFCFGALPVTTPKVIVAHSDVLSWADTVGKAPLADNKWLRTYRRLVQAGLHGVDAVIAPTHAALASTASHFRLPDSTAVIHNGRTFTDARAEARHLQAITAGRMWDPAKNLNMLDDLQTSMPLLVAGENGDATIRNRMMRLLGRQTEEQLLTHFRQSAIYICCSLYEPFGLAALEAALCGCAIVANDLPSLREVWGDAALYFRDAPTLDRILTELAQDAERLAQAQAACMTRAHDFSTERMTTSYLAKLKQVLAARAESHAHAA